MRKTLGIFLLLGILIGSDAVGQISPDVAGQTPAIQGGVSAWPNYMPESLANAPAEVKAAVGSRDRMERYVADNPGSPYELKVRNALASGYRKAGRITPALRHWSAVWRQLGAASDPDSYGEANHALAGQLELLTMLGRVEALPGLLKAADGRQVSDAEDRQRIRAAREGYFMMLREPALNYRCGTLALAEIARMQGKPDSAVNALIEEPSPKPGISLLRLLQLSRLYDLGLVAVKRTDDAPLPVPCVVHWSQNHYGALLEYNANLDCYRTVFGEPNWMSSPDVNAEASGYFLIPAAERPSSWPLVSDAECAQVQGRSFIYTINDSKDKGCNVNPTDPKAKCPQCSGMPVWWVTEPYINLFLADEPVSYTTSRGENFAFRITVKQRDSVGNFFAYPRPGLLHNWFSRIYVHGMPVTTTQYVTNFSGTNITGITTNHLPVFTTNGFSSWTATLDLPTGGQVTYNSSSNWNSSYDEETKTYLLPSYGSLSDGTTYVVPGFPQGGSHTPPDSGLLIAGTSYEYGYGYWNDAASGFRVVHADGSVDRYGLIYWRSNGVAGYYESEALLTQRTDPIGNDVNLVYELYTNSSSIVCFRLKQVVDCDGRTNAFSYYSSNPSLLQNITTPYGQTAAFAYDSQGNLTNITDAATNSSGLVWDTNGRVSTLNTPYGPTSFNYFDADLPGTNDSSINGDVAVNRSVSVLDANGGTRIYAYCFNSQNETPSQFPTSAIPQATPLGTLDTGTNEVGHDYAAVSFRNSFYWNARQAAALSTTSVSLMTSNDFSKARMQHWLGDSNNVSQTSLLSAEQEPSPDATTPGQLTFYDYYGKSLRYLQGTNSQIAVTARRQPSGNTEYKWEQYNHEGYVTKDVSTYALPDSTIGTRTNTFIYATNTISFVLSNSAPGAPAGTLLYLNDGGYYINGYSEQVPTAPLFAVYESSSNTCGAWSMYVSGTSTISLANLLVSSIDASGATNSYGGYAQVSKVFPVHTYFAWWNPTEPYFNGNVTDDYYWYQSIIRTFTPPLPTRITNAVGYVTTYAYDGSNRLASVSVPSGLTTTNSYDTNGFLSTTVDVQTGRTNSFTYLNGKVHTWQNERGLVTTSTWDSLQRLITKSDSEGYVSNVYTRLDLTGSRDKLGNWTHYGYDALQNLVAVTNANSDIALSSYCSCGALEWTRDAITNYTYYYHDLAGRLTSVQYPDGYVVTNAYDALNHLVCVSDSLGYVTNTYNLQGLPTLSANAVGIIQSNSYDILDRHQAVTDARGIVTAYSYDALSRVLTNIVAGKLTNSFAYATNGLVKAADGLLTNFTYFVNDPMGRAVARTNANSEVTQFRYDPSGNITNIVDGRSQNTYFQFDSFSRMTNKLDNTQASILKLTYDANGQIKTRWTPEKGTTTYVRDPMGRVRTNSYPSNPQVLFTYDANGHLSTVQDGIGTTTFTYSPAGQLQSEGGLWVNDAVSRTYRNQLRTGLTIGSIGTTYYYDSAHRLYSISASSGSYGYTYHPVLGGSYSSPLVSALSLPYGMSVTNGYDTAGRFTATVLLSSNLVALDSEKYAYDADSRRTNQTRYDNSSVTSAYDNVGQLKTSGAKESGATTRLNEQFGYAYDTAGNLSARTNNTLTLNFTANSVNQVTNSARAGTLTAVGNTAQAVTSAKVNGQNSALYGDKTFATTAGLSLANGANTFTTIVQYAAQAVTNIVVSQLPTPVVYLYDANGNLTNDGLRSFRYDDENQLTNVTVAGQWKSEYAYDGLNRRRIVRAYSWNGSWNLTNEVHYVYDGKLAVQERDTNNNIIATYDRGLDLSGSLAGAGGIGGLLARTDIKGTVYYRNDAMGNVTMLVDRYQTLEARYLYDPYGNLIGKWGGYADVNHYRFSSKEWDANAGLYYFGQRFYDPNLQRWISRDPAGEFGGMDLYGYVGNSPANIYDPMGLCGGWSWSKFGDWELGKLTSAKEFFTGKPEDFKPDPNSLLYLSNQAGVGNTALTDKDGNPVSPADLAFDVLTSPVVALTTGALGEMTELAAGGEMMAASDLSPSVPRVFWSGGEEAQKAAEAFANRIGGTTLELSNPGLKATSDAMIAAGEDWFTSVRPTVWEPASRAFAEGASGVVHVFQYFENGLQMSIENRSVWRTIEYPALKANQAVTDIRYHLLTPN